MRRQGMRARMPCRRIGYDGVCVVGIFYQQHVDKRLDDHASNILAIANHLIEWLQHFLPIEGHINRTKANDPHENR